MIGADSWKLNSNKSAAHLRSASHNKNINIRDKNRNKNVKKNDKTYKTTCADLFGSVGPQQKINLNKNKKILLKNLLSKQPKVSSSFDVLGVLPETLLKRVTDLGNLGSLVIRVLCLRKYLTDDLRVMPDGIQLDSYSGSAALDYYFKYYEKREEDCVELFCLAQFLTAHPQIYDNVCYENEVLERLIHLGDYLGAIVLSLVTGNMVLQIMCHESFALMLLDYTLCDLCNATRTEQYSLYTERSTHCFPVKNHSGAQYKVTVSATDLVRGMSKWKPVLLKQIEEHNSVLAGMTNDQVAAVLLYCSATNTVLPFPRNLQAAVGGICQPSDAKVLNVALKALGFNGTLVGANLCELQNLQGRGVGELDLEEECRKRMIYEGNGTVMNFPAEKLKQAILQILRSELGDEQVAFDEPEAFWDRSWEWCVNGSHPRGFEEYEEAFRVPMIGQIKRRAAVESYVDNPLYTWSGKTYINPLQKLEHGKTRLLLGADTATYMCFEHLLKPIEKAWRGRRVLLDPGRGGHYGLVRRVRKMCESRLYFMLDFDDFNSQHTHTSIEVLFETLCEYTGYDAELTDRIVKSFRNSVFIVGGKVLGYSAGTLNSGHRATSVINTILNAAYILCASPDFWDKNTSLHTGDDVIAGVSVMTEATNLVASLKTYGCRLNPQKQSLGRRSGEFLRVAMNESFAIGYSARSVASLISGNWTNDKKLGPLEKIQTLINSTWSLCNRSANQTACDVLAIALNYQTGIAVKNLVALFRGDLAMDGGPIRANRPIFDVLRCVTLESEEVRMSDAALIELKQQPGLATSRYLSNCLDNCERAALLMAGVSVKMAMLEASYAKSLTCLTRDTPTFGVKFVRKTGVRPLGSVDMRSVYCRNAEKGVFSDSPVLVLLKKRLTHAQLRILLREKGTSFNERDCLMSLEEFCWGRETRNILIMGYCSYSDASSAGRKTRSGVLYTDIPVLV